MRTHGTPTGINATVGALVVVVCCAVPPHLDAAGVAARLAVLALGVFAFSVAACDLVAAAVSAGIAFLLFDGFVLGRAGDLAWHGNADLVRIGVLAGAALAGTTAGALRLRIEARRAQRAGERAVAALPRPRSAAEGGPAPRTADRRQVP